MSADGRGKGTYRGKLISVGGSDRVRVPALAMHLERWLHARGVQVVQFSLPTRGPVGALIRLQAQSRLRLDPVSLALLWTADRLDLLSREGGILAQLEAGTTVLCMRYAWWETCHKAENLVDPIWLERINARCTRPDLALCADGERSLGLCQQEISALLWPGEEVV